MTATAEADELDIESLHRRILRVILVGAPSNHQSDSGLEEPASMLRPSTTLFRGFENKIADHA